jgi:hypothetical protein
MICGFESRRVLPRLTRSCKLSLDSWPGKWAGYCNQWSLKSPRTNVKSPEMAKRP